MMAMKIFLGGMALLITHLGDTLCHETHTHEVSSAKAEEIRNKINNNQWEIKDIIDADHLIAELKEVVDLQQKGELTQEEMNVYLFRLHDFDHNEKLDGLEVRAIFMHSIGDNATQELLEKAVDATMGMDQNDDGFLSYPELKVRLEQDKEKEKEKAKEMELNPQPVTP